MTDISDGTDQVIGAPLPKVSVVIPTYNRRARLHRVLVGLSAQDYAGPIETVVVSDGSVDGTDAYLLQLQDAATAGAEGGTPALPAAPPPG